MPPIYEKKMKKNNCSKINSIVPCQIMTCILRGQQGRVYTIWITFNAPVCRNVYSGFEKGKKNNNCSKLSLTVPWQDVTCVLRGEQGRVYTIWTIFTAPVW